MPQLPIGTVTFLFTDIEGSTKLLEELGEAYQSALAEHRDRIRDSVARHGGAEVDTQGDAFFIAFTRASDAVAAAVDVQEALAAGPVRVRMGLHTGEPSVTAEGYVGIDVHRAARIGNAANGDQIVVSPATRQLLDDSFELRDLGEHRLKDFPAATRLFQVGQREFPPLRTPDEARLPIPATPLVGRKKELRDALRLLNEEVVRLLTVTGPGGVGKTRFAVEVATESLTRFTDGVRFADLSPLRSADGVLPAIAQTVRARGAPENALRERHLLLVLDNVEHVTAAGPALGALLDECRRVSMLVTSREPLHLTLERELPLRTMAEAPAVELFRQRVRMTEPDFEGEYGTSAQICARLDGLPLAIELAAARVKALGESGLLERLDRRLPLLTGRGRDIPERQKTLRATIEWSYDLLDEEEQRVFAALSVFVGGFTLEAAEAVAQADLDIVESLVLKSLVRRDERRLAMLDTVREFALERLAASDEAAVRRRHAEYFRSIVEPLFALRKAESPERFLLIESLRAEYDNVLAALTWYAEAGDAEGQLRLALGFFPYWYNLGPWTDARRLTDEALARYQERDALRANGLCVSAVFAWRSGQARAGLAVAREAREIARGVDDEELEFSAVLAVGTTADNAGEFELAEHAYQEAETLAREAANPRRLSSVLNNLGNLAIHQRQLAKAKAYLEEAVEIDREHGFESGLANSLIDLGFIALAEGAVNDAPAHIRESLELARDHGLDETLSWGLLAAAAVGSDRRSWTDAAKLLGAVAALQERFEMGSYYELGEEFAERTERTVREQVGDEAFAAAASTGRSIPRAQAIELAFDAVG
jgi:predicted ATPase/Tfp pilus assembly protein PilF